MAKVLRGICPEEKYKRFADDISGFEDAYRELVAVANPHIADQTYVFENLLYLFDNLGLTKV
jgi:hypothetical protein